MPVQPPLRNKPPVLNPGATVGIIAPGTVIDPERLKAGCLHLEQLGYKPYFRGTIFDKDLYFAGSVHRRAKEIMEMFRRDDIEAILCARGGYGCNYLLEELDPEVIAANPKLFIGYSDVTTLLTYFVDRAEMTVLHGPMVTNDFASTGMIDLGSWDSATTGDEKWRVNCDGVTSMVAGKAEGTLYGGCLSLLAASLGTPWEIQTEDTILFIEDVNTKPFQIDRMLMQLKYADKFSGVRGIIFGQMMDCIQHEKQGYTLQEVIERIVSDFGIPVVYGLRSGHVTHGNVTLPFGVRARLVVSLEGAVQLTIMESATRPVQAARSAKK